LLLNQLISLNVTVRDTLAYHHLQIILDQSSQLNSLKFRCLQESRTGIFQLTSSTIRRLDLTEAHRYYIKSFNQTDCYQLINSSIGRRCEILLIHIENQTSILDFIERMSNLQVLIFGCSDTRQIDGKYLSTNQNVVQWLQNNLPSTCSITRDPNDTSLIHIQINR
jgi:hypothetical protein